MSPLEINKKIAGIKRLNWVSSNTTNPALIDHDELPTSDRLHPPKNWAENIADAWDLFEETIFRNGALLGRCNDKWVIQDFTERPIVLADTAPLAICLAWLKWKADCAY